MLYLHFAADQRRANPSGDGVGWIPSVLEVAGEVPVGIGCFLVEDAVRSVKAGERRLERLRSPTVRDNRISYGCINVPVAFFDRVIERAVGKRRGIVVYVLPDTKPLEAVFDFGRASQA